MPQIIPIRDMKDTAKLSEMCAESQEPIFVTKNGYGNMVVMSMDVYEKTMLMHDVYDKIASAEDSIANGRVKDAREALKARRNQYEV